MDFHDLVVPALGNAEGVDAAYFERLAKVDKQRDVVQRRAEAFAVDAGRSGTDSMFPPFGGAGVVSDPPKGGKTLLLTSRTIRVAAGVLAASGLLAVMAPAAGAAPASYTCVTANNVRYHAAPDAGSTTYGEVHAGQGFNITD